MYLNTKLFRMTELSPDPDAVRACAGILSSGGLVVFPTETVYGLGADATNEHAVASVYAAKRRPPEKALLCHLRSVAQAEEIAYIGDTARALISAFDPGPLTVIVKKKPCLSDTVTAGQDTVGLRFPSSPVFLALAEECPFPIAATSANMSGEPSNGTCGAVIRDLSGRVDAIIDAGSTSVGVPSTIISLCGSRPVILREGAVTRGMIEGVIGKW